jgi:hypothetical protein
VAKRKNGAHLSDELVHATGAGSYLGRQNDKVHNLISASVLSHVHVDKRPRNGRAYDAVVADLCSDHATCPDH